MGIELLGILLLGPLLVLVGYIQLLLPLVGFVTVVPPIPLQTVSEVDDEELEGVDDGD